MTASQTAEGIVKNREEIKQKTLVAARQKIGDILHVEDIVIRNIDLSTDLERAIEAKMSLTTGRAGAVFADASASGGNHGDYQSQGRCGGDQGARRGVEAEPRLLKVADSGALEWQVPLVVPTGGNNNGASLLLPLGAPDQAPAP